jgi:hypothetical protein
MSGLAVTYGAGTQADHVTAFGSIRRINKNTAKGVIIICSPNCRSRREGSAKGLGAFGLLSTEER